MELRSEEISSIIKEQEVGLARKDGQSAGCKSVG